MRVALACPYAWDAAGGVQVHIRGLADGLTARGHEALILAPATGRVPEPDVRVVGRPIRIPYGGKVTPICFSRASWRRVREILRVFEPEVVHAHEPFSPSTSMFAVLSSVVPVVATFHAFHERSVLLRIGRPALAPIARRITAPVAVSEAAAAFAARVVRRWIERVPNGVDVGRFSDPGPRPTGLPEGRVLLWVGRLDPQKGFPIAVRAFAELATRYEDLRLVVAGDGRDRGAVDDLPTHVRSRVVMLGGVANEGLPAYYGASEVSIAAATGHESFGVVLVEAMAAGVPVVATDIPGYREVVRDGTDGLLVPPGDARALAGAVGRVLEDHALAARLSESGRARSRAFSWDEVVPRIEAIYAAAARS